MDSDSYTRRENRVFAVVNSMSFGNILKEKVCIMNELTIKMRPADERWNNEMLAAELTDGYFFHAIASRVGYSVTHCIHSSSRHISRHVFRYDDEIGSLNSFSLFYVLHYSRHCHHRTRETLVVFHSHIDR